MALMKSATSLPPPSPETLQAPADARLRPDNCFSSLLKGPATTPAMDRQHPDPCQPRPQLHRSETAQGEKTSQPASSFKPGLQRVKPNQCPETRSGQEREREQLRQQHLHRPHSLEEGTEVPAESSAPGSSMPAPASAWHWVAYSPAVTR